MTAPTYTPTEVLAMAREERLLESLLFVCSTSSGNVKELLDALIYVARASGMHDLVKRIESGNFVSLTREEAERLLEALEAPV